ncbi:trypsin-like serine protease [Amycolatopsis sp. FBCC-B4732]|uniref:trypsin-like serine protease n=1 Tax=Amycolatopsis sp. FBCC-B4732 TaxID=3079339 RepID=UPI001FF5A69E|nr:trypsin-like serine protease [Amycolatopsis sp. FBCC-B4732]UOX85884.1 trypsin-like serine protease [Amycolatopsis sp. FBCC-B4732]
MRKPSLLVAAFLATAALSPPPAAAAPPPLVPLGTAPAVPAGATADGSALPGRLTVSVALKPRDAAGAERYVAATADPASPVYHRYLSAAEYTERFGPAPSSVDQVREYLSGKGLRVEDVTGNRQVVTASGPPSAVESAFGTSVSGFRSATGERFFNATKGIAVPAGVATIVRGVTGLTNRPAAHRASGPAGPAGPAGGYTPAQLRTAYSMGGLSGGYDGSGETVGLIEFDTFKQADIDAWTQYFKQPAVTPELVKVDGGVPNPGSDQLEVTLDIQAVAATAPKAKQVVYSAPNSDQAWVHEMAKIASDNKITILSGSWLNGEVCESDPIAASHDSYTQLAAQGVTMLSASGDWGGTGCGYQGDNRTIQADYPASDPLFTGVGGTQLRTSDSAGTWQAESCWNQGSSGNTRSGGGYSKIYARPDWQPGTNQYRSVPDVSLLADYGAGALSVYMNGGWQDVGGTSLSSPLWAGYVAMLNQKSLGGGKSRLGQLNPDIYKIAGSADYASTFHDVTSGGNGTYNAGTGYDLCTGWGSPKADALGAKLLGGGETPPPSGDFTLSASPSSGSVAAGSAVSTTVTAAAPASSGIVGGTPTTTAAHPFIISMRREGSAFPGQQSCTGTLFGPHTVLLAAHCLLEKPGHKWFVYGADDLTQNTGTTAEIAAQWVHPDYSDWSAGADVAVVTLDRDVPVPSGITYPKLNTDPGLEAAGTKGLSIGWGETGANTYSNVLRQADIPVAADSACRGRFTDPHGQEQYKTPSMLCTGYADHHASACVGDSGGPYLVGNTVVGVFSWMSTACDWYAVYARVSTYAADIAPHLPGGDTPPPSGAITLTASGLPSGATAAFSPSSVDVGGHSTLTVTTSASTPAGTYDVTISGRSAKSTQTAHYSLTVTGGPSAELKLTNPGTQNSRVGQPANVPLAASGGTTPYRWSSTALAPGLTLDPASGVVSGTPSRADSRQVTVTVTDASGKKATASFFWFVFG